MDAEKSGQIDAAVRQIIPNFGTKLQPGRKPAPFEILFDLNIYKLFLLCSSRNLRSIKSDRVFRIPHAP
jgi:hypothetical protein